VETAAIGRFALAFAFDLIVSASLLWAGMKLTSKLVGMPGRGQYCSYLDLLKVAAVSALLFPIPYAGPVLSGVAMYYMLRRVTEADGRDLWLMVAVTRLTSIVIILYTPSLIALSHPG
jgi:hypothetical protein